MRVSSISRSSRWHSWVVPEPAFQNDTSACMFLTRMTVVNSNCKILPSRKIPLPWTSETTRSLLVMPWFWLDWDLWTQGEWAWRLGVNDDGTLATKIMSLKVIPTIVRFEQRGSFLYQQHHDRHNSRTREDKIVRPLPGTKSAQSPRANVSKVLNTYLGPKRRPTFRPFKFKFEA